MLEVEWYYSDAGLGHNDDDIYILTQLPQKNHTAKIYIIYQKDIHIEL